MTSLSNTDILMKKVIWGYEIAMVQNESKKCVPNRIDPLNKIWHSKNIYPLIPVNKYVIRSEDVSETIYKIFM